jgi:hypothetical protein
MYSGRRNISVQQWQRREERRICVNSLIIEAKGDFLIKEQKGSREAPLGGMG